MKMNQTTVKLVPCVKQGTVASGSWAEKVSYKVGAEWSKVFPRRNGGNSSDNSSMSTKNAEFAVSNSSIQGFHATTQNDLDFAFCRFHRNTYFSVNPVILY